MKTNRLRYDPTIIAMLGGDDSRVRHYFERCLSLGWISTRGATPIQFDELAYVSLSAAMGFVKTPEMQQYTLEQEHTPYFDSEGMNFLVLWEDIIANGPAGIDEIIFHQSENMIVVNGRFEGSSQRVFKNARSKKSNYGSALFRMDQRALAHMHSEAHTHRTYGKPVPLTDEELAALIQE